MTGLLSLTTDHSVAGRMRVNADDRRGGVRGARRWMRGPAGTVTLVNRVRSRVQGLTCSTCPSAAEAAVRRRLGNVAITWDQAGQTIDLAFEQSASSVLVRVLPSGPG